MTRYLLALIVLGGGWGLIAWWRSRERPVSAQNRRFYDREGWARGIDQSGIRNWPIVKD